MVGRDSIFGAFSALGDAIALNSAVVLVPGVASTIDLDQLRAAADGRGRRTPLHASVNPPTASAPCIDPAIFLANDMSKDHPVIRIVRARRPETGFARKAGDCFGFSPSFTEWIFILAHGGRLRIDPPASAQRRPQPGHGADRRR
jgi:hypothetical protein